MDELSKGRTQGQGGSVKKSSVLEDSSSCASTCEMDNSAVHSERSISSISTLNQGLDTLGCVSSKTNNPSEFINHGKLIFVNFFYSLSDWLVMNQKTIWLACSISFTIYFLCSWSYPLESIVASYLIMIFTAVGGFLCHLMNNFSHKRKDIFSPLISNTCLSKINLIDSINFSSVQVCFGGTRQGSSGLETDGRTGTHKSVNPELGE